MNFILKTIIWLVAGLLFLLLSGITIEQILRTIARKNIKPDGEFISVGNHQLHYLKKGSGGPTVVFESGLDLGGHIPWMHIQEDISKYATTISYDRAGILWSNRGQNSKTVAAMSMELNELLKQIDCPKPYILVAHSMAGLTLRSFIQDNKADISGIVFIDVTHPNQRNAMEESLKEKVESPNSGIIKFLFLSGLYRLKNKTPYPDLSPADTINRLAGKIRFISVSASMEESDNIHLLQKEANTGKTFGDIPLVVISSDPKISSVRFPDPAMQDKYISLREELQKDLLKLSTQSNWCFAKKSGHYIHHCQPELIVKYILSLINNKAV